ncbi:MAG TPA: hypothetical protein EYH09_01875 [Candidatus Nanopusillus sp.]|nr:hypothetical protein [Candidatus Nanopusillus sp.]HIP90612.1 hypothetical protein [Candidatus Nanopusillus sp.]
MKIFISGNPRTGKTSLIRRVITEFGIDNFFGFWTEEIRENKKRVGFKIVATWGEKILLASTNVRTPYRIGKYFIIKENLDIFSSYMLDKIDLYRDRIIVIDEIGPMEFYSEKFKQLVRKVLKENYKVLATVHRKYIHLVPYYYWLEIGKWWKVYNNVKKNIKAVLSKQNNTSSV